MKRKISLILSILLLLQVVSVFSSEKVEAAPSTKVVNHTIIGTKFTISRQQGPATHYYDDGNFYGNLNKIKTTWEIQRVLDGNLWTSYYSNDKKELQVQCPSEEYMYDEIYWSGYRNIAIFETLWFGGIKEGNFTDFDGNPCRYMRSCGVRFEHDTFKFISYYEGTVTARNTNPELFIVEPIINHRTGNQDVIIISGQVKDEDIGNNLKIKYNLDIIKDQEIVLKQPTNLISNGQLQAFKGDIQLDGLKTGKNILKLYVEDNKGGKSEVVDIPIILFNTLENVLNVLKSYSYRAGETQIMVINSNSRISQSIENDRLISLLRTELTNKNVKLFFIGKDGVTENYIKSKLLSN